MELSSVRTEKRTRADSTAELRDSNVSGDGLVGQYGCTKAGHELISCSYKKKKCTSCCYVWTGLCLIRHKGTVSVQSTALLRFWLEVLCLAWERHGPVREDSENDKRSRKCDQKGLNEPHLFLRWMVTGKHDENLQICKKPLHRQAEKAVFPAHGRNTRCKLQQRSFSLGIFLIF